MKNCPECGSEDVTRDEVDIGVGIQYGPWFCATCGWHESSKPPEPMIEKDDDLPF